MFRFQSGVFAGMTVQQAMLRNAPRLYDIAKWAADKPNLKLMVQEFERLRRQLHRIPVVAECAEDGCQSKPRSMTLPVGKAGYGTNPYYWCDDHEPWRTRGISEKLPIDFDSMKLFDTQLERRAFHSQILKALGVKKGTRITVDFARHFFQLD